MSSSAMRGSSANSCDSVVSTATTAATSAGWHVAPARQQPRHAGAGDQRLRQRHVQRRQRHRAVGHHLDRRAALAEQQHRAEQRVDAGADDQLERLRPAHHGLDREAGDHGVGAQPGHALAHRRRSVAQHRRVDEVERHAADLALVRDLRRHDFQRHRVADRRRRPLRGAGIVRHRPRTGDRHAAGGQQVLDFGLAEPLAAIGQRGIDQRTHLRGVDRSPAGHAPAAPASAAPGYAGKS